MRRATWLRLASIAAAATLLPFVAAAPVSAAGIVVNSKTMLVQDDGTCTLPEAIKAANTDTASGVSSGECPAGAGADTITFSVSGTINTTRLPDITNALTIDGNGAVTLNAQQSSSFFIVSNTVHLQRLTFTKGRSQFGGAILVGGTGTLYLERTTVSSSVAQQGGAIYVGNNGTLYVIDSTLSGNTSSGVGGAISVGSGSTATITRSTLSGNKASYGGGVYAGSGSIVFVNNSTVAKNTVVNSGGGLYSTNTSAVSIRNSTIALNTAGVSAGGFYADTGASTEVGNSIIAGNSKGNVGGAIDVATNNILGGSITTLLDPNGLQSNGGPTKTIKLLSTASAALDQGSASLCANSPIDNVDQRGLTRGNPCDIGAVERDRGLPVTTGAVAHLRSGTSLSGTSMRAVLRWTGADTGGSGVARYQLQQRVNGGSYTTISSTLTGTSKSVTLANGSNYEFRVRAIDRDGNVGFYASVPVVKPRLVQNSSSAVTYNGTWTTSSSSSFSGGSARYATQGDDEHATYQFTGSSIAFVTTTGPTRGVVEIHVDNVSVGRIDLYSSTTKYRQVVFAKTFASSGSHAIRIYNYPPLGRKRADIDAFAVLK